jgi:hypothetical protein
MSACNNHTLAARYQKNGEAAGDRPTIGNPVRRQVHDVAALHVAACPSASAALMTSSAVTSFDQDARRNRGVGSDQRHISAFARAEGHNAFFDKESPKNLARKCCTKRS